MKIFKILSMAAVVLAVLGMVSCNSKKFHVSGQISEAQDSVLYFENMSLNGPVAVDSVRLAADGSFAFSGEAPESPEFYRHSCGHRLYGKHQGEGLLSRDVFAI